MCTSIFSGGAFVVGVVSLITASTAIHLPDLSPPPPPNLITDCPLYHMPDPESPEGPCICDMNMCPEPHCHPSETPITLPSSPSCCAAYQCVLCSDEDVEAKMCQCSTMPDVNSVIVGAVAVMDNTSYVDKKGECQCFGEESSWDWYKGCQCDVAKCRLPDLCLGNSVEVRIVEECCERVECVECPEDSIAQVAEYTQIEAKCVCRPCPDKVCSENEVTVIRKPGRNIPNHCCDLYDCIERGCTINETKYDEGEQWTIEKDTQCRCQNGIALCNKLFKAAKELMNCFYNGNSYRDGDVWTVDQCTNCTCHSGQSKCIAHLCMQINETVVTSPTICPPTLVPAYCDLLCAQYDVDAHGCHVCKCREMSADDMTDDGATGEGRVDSTVIIVIAVACILGVFVLTMTFLIVRRNCKRMRYYPETKHNLLLDNNNTSRDMYTATTKAEDQIILPLYKATSMENKRN